MRQSENLVPSRSPPFSYMIYVLCQKSMQIAHTHAQTHTNIRVQRKNTYLELDMHMK